MTHDEAVAFLVVQADRQADYLCKLSRDGLAPDMVKDEVPFSKFLEAADVLKSWETAWTEFRELMAVKWALGINTPETSGLLDSAIREMDSLDPRTRRIGSADEYSQVPCDHHRVKEGDTYDITVGHGHVIRYLLGPDGSLTLMGGSHRIEHDDADRDIVTMPGGSAWVPPPRKCKKCRRWYVVD